MGFWDGIGISWTLCTSLQTDNHSNTSSVTLWRSNWNIFPVGTLQLKYICTLIGSYFRWAWTRHCSTLSSVSYCEFRLTATTSKALSTCGLARDPPRLVIYWHCLSVRLSVCLSHHACSGFAAGEQQGIVYLWVGWHVPPPVIYSQFHCWRYYDT